MANAGAPATANAQPLAASLWHRPCRPVALSLRNLQAYLARLIQQLRGIFTQAARQLAQLLGRRPPLTQQPLELRQAVPGERSQVLAIVANQLIDLVSGGGEVVSDHVDALQGGHNFGASLIDNLSCTLGRCSQIRGSTVQL